MQHNVYTMYLRILGPGVLFLECIHVFVSSVVRDLRTHTALTDTHGNCACTPGEDALVIMCVITGKHLLHLHTYINTHTEWKETWL